MRPDPIPRPGLPPAVLFVAIFVVCMFVIAAALGLLQVVMAGG